jgi:hypothetical protein
MAALIHRNPYRMNLNWIAWRKRKPWKDGEKIIPPNFYTGGRETGSCFGVKVRENE